MRTEHQPELVKIRHVSTILLPILYLTFLFIALMVILVTWWTYTSPTSTGEHFFELSRTLSVQPEQIRDGLLTARDKSWLMTGMVSTVLLILPGVYFAIRIVHNFRGATIFSMSNVRYARTIALLYLVYIVLGSLANLYTSWTPEGFDVNFNPLFFSKNWIILALLWVCVWILDIGRTLQLDSDMTI